MINDSRALRDLPVIVVGIIIATIPLEISKLFLPAFGSANRVDGRVASSLDLARLAILVLLGLIVLARQGAMVIAPRGALGGLIAAFTAVAVASVFWSEAPAVTINESIRLAFFVMGYAAIVAALDSEMAVKKAVTILEYVLIVVAFATIVQKVTGVFLWNFPLRPTGRVNLTYADPNHLGGHIALGLVLLAADREPNAGGKATRRYLLMIALLFGGGLVTGSRSSLLALLIGLSYVTVRGARLGSRWPRRVLMFVGGLVAIVFVVDRQVRDRFATLLQPGSLGPRQNLLSAGWAMYLDHPIVGVGMGAFPNVFRSDYPQLFSYYGSAGVNSHTSAMTVLAELGLVGLALIVAVVAAALTRPPRLHRYPAVARRRLGLEAGLLILVMTSQSEGRLIQDPMFWVVLALLAALDQNLRRTEHSTAQRVRSLSAQPAA